MFYLFVCLCMQQCRVDGWDGANSQDNLYLFVNMRTFLGKCDVNAP